MIEKGIVVVGSTTIDQNITPQASFVKIGGVTAYAGFTYQRHGLACKVVSNIAQRDGPILRRFTAEGISVCSIPTKHTTRFLNYIDDDRRVQKLPVAAAGISGRQIAAAIENLNWVHLGPLHPADIDIEAIQRLSATKLFVILDVQGYVRGVKNNTVYPHGSSCLAEALKAAFLVKANQAELKIILDCLRVKMSDFSGEFGIREIVVTMGKAGGYIQTADGERIQYKAEKINAPVDRTGAGDVFLAAYVIYRFFRKQSPQAAAGAAARLSARQIEGKYLDLNLKEGGYMKWQTPPKA